MRLSGRSGEATDFVDLFGSGERRGFSEGHRLPLFLDDERRLIEDYKLATDPLKCLTRDPVPLAKIQTRLEKMPRDVQNRLMNWGYAICDAALRAHVDAPLQKKLGIQITDTDKFPFPGGY